MIFHFYSGNLYFTT